MSPSAIGRQFTVGQLFVISWWLNQRAEESELGEHRGSDMDLLHLSGEELQRHLADLGA